MEGGERADGGLVDAVWIADGGSYSCFAEGVEGGLELGACGGCD